MNNKLLMLSALACVFAFFLTSCSDDEDNSPEEPTEDNNSAADDSADEKDSSYLIDTINGHVCVDLGLSVKWATCNVGASSPEEYGDYFAWGETTTKSSYTEHNSKTWEEITGNIAGNASYDAARANWGGTWRLPTADEIDELVNQCETEETTVNGVAGRMVTGPNGNSIFLPAAGYRYGTSLYGDGDYGYYWSGTPDESNAQYAYELYFYGDYFFQVVTNCNSGQSVRAVSD